MSKKKHTDGGVDGAHIKGFTVTNGGVGTPVEAFQAAGTFGKPADVGEYGAPSEAEIPTTGKEGGGTGNAIKAFFGTSGRKP